MWEGWDMGAYYFWALLAGTLIYAVSGFWSLVGVGDLCKDDLVSGSGSLFLI